MYSAPLRQGNTYCSYLVSSCDGGSMDKPLEGMSLQAATELYSMVLLFKVWSSD